MKVYILRQRAGAEYDCWETEGVYSTMEKAKEAESKMRASCWNGACLWIDIEERDLDHDWIG